MRKSLKEIADEAMIVGLEKADMGDASIMFGAAAWHVFYTYVLVKAAKRLAWLWL